MSFKNPRTCRNCGSTFEASKQDVTVNCPACRKPRERESACVVCEGERFITIGPSAVTGEFRTVPCHRCNPGG